MEQNVFGWIEIPVTDMPRAIAFYEAVFKWKLHHVHIGELEMAWFPNAEVSKPVRHRIIGETSRILQTKFGRHTSIFRPTQW